MGDLERRLTSLIARFGERRLILVLLALGFAVRVAALAHFGFGQSAAENSQVAMSIASGHGYVNAFRPYSGPTAHTGPLAPLPLAAIFSVVGTRGMAPTLVIEFVSILMVVISFWLVERCFAQLGASGPIRILATAFVCLVPVQIKLESKELSIWDNGYAAAALAAILLIVLKLDRKGEPRLPAMMLIGGCAALLEIFNPASGLAAVGLLGLLLLRRVRWTGWLPVIGSVVLVYLAVTIPWTIRNEKVLHAPISSRSSLGISLAITYYDGVLDKPPAAGNIDRLKEIHPNVRSGPGYARMIAAGGEIPYAKALKAGAMGWIKAHPGGAAFIWLRNLRDFYFPPAWHWDRLRTRASRSASLYSFTLGALSAAALVGIAWSLLWRRRWRWLYIAAAVLIPAAPYVLTYPLLRYRYPVSSLLIFLAFVGLAQAWHGLRARRQGGAPQEP